MAVVDIEKRYAELETSIKKSVESLGSLCLASVVVGEDKSAQAYITIQEKLAKAFGIKFLLVSLDKDIVLKDFQLEIKELNEDKTVTGIIINKPFPFGLEEEIFSLIAEDKDVEGVHPNNLGKLFIGNFAIAELLAKSVDNILLPPTVRSILDILYLSSSINVRGKKITLVGFSSIIGKPLALLLANEFATVSIAHIGTYESGDLPFYVANADIVISAVGKPEIIKGEWIKKGTVVIDVGMGQVDGKLCGDVEFKEAKEKASFITPVPGGVGKLTPLYLYLNLVLAGLNAKN